MFITVSCRCYKPNILPENLRRELDDMHRHIEVASLLLLPKRKPTVSSLHLASCMQIRIMT